MGTLQLLHYVVAPVKADAAYSLPVIRGREKLRSPYPYMLCRGREKARGRENLDLDFSLPLPIMYT